MPTEGANRTTFAQLIAEGTLEVGDGYRAKNDELGGTGILFLRAGHLTDTHIDFDGVERFRADLEERVRSKMARPGDAVVTTKGNSTGRTAFVSVSMPPFVYSPHLSYWRSLDPSRIEAGFLRYWSRSVEFAEQLGAMKASTDMAPYLSLIDQKRLRITLPAVEDQRSIARVLGALDEKIELNRRMSGTLESMARALFKSWFVDFDIVRAKAEGGEAGLPKPIADLFPSRLVDSDHGEIPEGWQWTTLAELAHLNPEVWAPRSRPATIKYVDLSNTKWGRIEAVATHGAANAPSRAQRVVRPGDTIVGTVRPGNGSYALISMSGLTASTGFAVLRPKAVEWAALVYLAATASQNIERLAHLADGGAYPAVRPEAVAATPVLRPSAELLGKFSSTITPLLTRMAANDRESRSLTEIRDTLLPRLLSGAVRLQVERPSDAN